MPDAGPYCCGLTLRSFFTASKVSLYTSANIASISGLACPVRIPKSVTRCIATVGAEPESDRGNVALRATARKGVASGDGLACKYRFSQPSETDLFPGAPDSI